MTTVLFSEGQQETQSLDTTLALLQTEAAKSEEDSEVLNTTANGRYRSIQLRIEIRTRISFI